LSLIDEAMAEQAALDWFEGLGYGRVFGPDTVDANRCLYGNGCFRLGNTP